MKKLKCWKKTTGKDEWRNIKYRNKLVEIYSWNKSHIVQNEKGFNAKGLIRITKSKSKALASAQEYMGGHNTC